MTQTATVGAVLGKCQSCSRIGRIVGNHFWWRAQQKNRKKNWKQKWGHWRLKVSVIEDDDDVGESFVQCHLFRNKVQVSHATAMCSADFHCAIPLSRTQVRNSNDVIHRLHLHCIHMLGSPNGWAALASNAKVRKNFPCAVRTPPETEMKGCLC